MHNPRHLKNHSTFAVVLLNPTSIIQRGGKKTKKKKGKKYFKKRMCTGLNKLYYSVKQLVVIKSSDAGPRTSIDILSKEAE